MVSVTVRATTGICMALIIDLHLPIRMTDARSIPETKATVQAMRACSFHGRPATSSHRDGDEAV